MVRYWAQFSKSLEPYIFFWKSYYVLLGIKLESWRGKQEKGNAYHARELLNKINKALQLVVTRVEEIQF